MQKQLTVLIFMITALRINGQDIYYVRPNLPNVIDNKFYFSIFHVEACKDSTLFQIKNTVGVSFIRDIAVCPDGQFYLAISNGNFPYEQIGKLNMQDSSLVILDDFDAGNSMVCDGNGVLWTGPLLNSYDTNSGVATSYGYIGYQLAGDMTFRDGNLYGTTIDNELVEINPLDIGATHVVYQYPLVGVQAYAVVSDVKSCDSTVTYINTTNLNVNSSVDSVNAIYAIDPITQTMTFVCNTPHAMWGATTPSEFLASDCTLRLDLDADNSSGAPENDWQAPVLCAGSVVSLADTDATWYSGYHTDSVRVRLLAPAPDAPLEYLSAVASGSVLVNGQGSGWLTLGGMANTAVPAANLDIQTVIRSLQWHNDALPVTPGIRTVEIIAYGPGGRSDTAYARLEVPVLRSAGLDTTFSICSNAPSFGLLTPEGDPGGQWSPTVTGGGQFSPASDPSGTYLYSIDNGACPADTALVAVTVMPLPVFSLGQDTAVCAGDNLLLSAPGNATWQDGTTSASYAVSASGLFSATYADANGCQFSDSIAVMLKQPMTGQSSVQRCAGQPYNWNGQMLLADTTLCLMFTGSNGCDSTHCLTLSFFYPTLQLDTSICSGQTLNWLGSGYAQSGVYQDTILQSGCLTAARLQLTVNPPDTLIQNVSVCDGEQYTVGNQTYANTGHYVIPLQTAFGCDSIVKLNLTVKPPISASLAAMICKGETYLFDGVTLSQEGTYSATFQTQEGCDSLVTLVLSLRPQPVAVITGDSVFCHGAGTALSVGNFVSYQWSGSGNTQSIDVGASGNYSVTVTDVNGCTGAAAISVLELPPLMTNWEITDPTCPGSMDGVIEFSGASGGVLPLAFSLNGQNMTTGYFSNLGAGEYSGVVTDSLGCSETTGFTLVDPPELTVELGASPTLEVGNQYAIPVQINQSGVFSYNWSPPTGLDCSECPNPVVTASDSITYVLVLTSSSGCTAQDTITILVRQGEGIYVPQIFSPNEDGQNESFTVYGDPDLVQDVALLRIYDRWGELVFEQQSLTINDEAAGWQGTLRGRPVLPGVYVWYAEIRMRNGSIVFKKGELTVVR